MGGFKIIEDRPTPKAVYNRRVYGLSIICAAGALTFGYDNAFFGTTVARASFTSDFGYTGHDANWKSQTTANLTSIFLGGATVGSLIAWPFMERFGRVRPLQGASAIFIAGACVMVAAHHNIAMMYAGRIVTGLAVGGLTAVIPTFIAEMAPPPIRGQLTGFFDIAYQLGALTGFWINYGITKSPGIDPTKSISWRIPVAVQLIPSGLFAIGTLFMRESPSWLLRKGRDEEAMRNLCYLRKLSPDDTYILEEVGMVRAVIAAEQRIAGDQTGMWGYLRGAFRELRQPAMLHRINLVFWVFGLMCWSGALSMNYYSPSIFSSVGITDIPLYTGIYGLFKAFGAIGFYLTVIDRAGRRAPWLLSASLCCVCLIYLAVYVKVAAPGAKDAAGQLLPVSASSAAGGKAAIFIIMFYSACWGFGGNGLPWIVTSEMFPIDLRSITGAYASFCHWLHSFAVTMGGPAMKNSWGWGMFLFYAVINAITFIFTFMFIPETKGVPIECMDELWSGTTKYCQYRQKAVYPPDGVPGFRADLIQEVENAKMEAQHVERV